MVLPAESASWIEVLPKSFWMEGASSLGAGASAVLIENLPSCAATIGKRERTISSETQRRVMGEHSAKRMRGKKTKPPEVRRGARLIPLSRRERGERVSAPRRCRRKRRGGRNRS